MAPFFIGLLSVLLGIVSVLIVLIVLMQRPKQEGLGAAFGGGMTDQMFGAQTTNVLQKGTVYLAVMFFVFALIISVLTAKSVRGDSDAVDQLKAPVAEVEKPVVPAGSTAPKPIQTNTLPVGDNTKVDTPAVENPAVVPGKSGTTETPGTETPVTPGTTETPATPGTETPATGTTPAVPEVIEEEAAEVPAVTEEEKPGE